MRVKVTIMNDGGGVLYEATVSANGSFSMSFDDPIITGGVRKLAGFSFKPKFTELPPALIPPALSDGKEIVRVGENRLCVCDPTATCPLGKTGPGRRCSELELHDAECGTQRVGVGGFKELPDIGPAEASTFGTFLGEEE